MHVNMIFFRNSVQMMCFNHYDLTPDGKFKRLKVAIQAFEYLDTEPRH